jgi:hypothetical protein
MPSNRFTIKGQNWFNVMIAAEKWLQVLRRYTPHR